MPWLVDGLGSVVFLSLHFDRLLLQLVPASAISYASDASGSGSGSVHSNIGGGKGGSNSHSVNGSGGKNARFVGFLQSMITASVYSVYTFGFFVIFL
jgi:hypothetical protein